MALKPLSPASRNLNSNKEMFAGKPLTRSRPKRRCWVGIRKGPPRPSSEASGDVGRAY